MAVRQLAVEVTDFSATWMKNSTPMHIDNVQPAWLLLALCPPGHHTVYFLI